MQGPPIFSSRLVWWRKKRGFSQLQLATAAACSQRHISFLELSRSKPSREMVLRLSTVLEVPLRHSNELLRAAGYAPVWTETDLGAPTLAPIRDALDYMLTQQEPVPAVVVDRRWNLVQANKAAVALIEFLVGPSEPSVVEKLSRYQDVQSVMSPAAPPSAEGPVLAMHFRKGETELRLFTTIATLGTPQDITLQELRIESFFPMDDETRSVFLSWAAAAKSEWPAT